MRFLIRDDASLLERKLRREIAEHGDPKFVLYYESRDQDYAAAAHVIARSAGGFSEATLLFQWCLSGDGGDERAPNDERWTPYRRWRASHGESRRLSDAPGHRFEAGEVEHLSNLISFALALGWDALLSAKPGRQLLLLSHDDRLQIYRGFGGRTLLRQLTKTGDWCRADR
jgi:hypothetical protein